MALPSSKLAMLRPGVKVRLGGPPKPQPEQPTPLGWREVVETNAKPSMGRPASVIKVVGDMRWLPVDLIEEIVP